MKNPYVNLAFRAIKLYLKTKKVLIPSPSLDKKLLTEQGGVFICFHNKQSSRLRGCIGTIAPAHKNLAEEIIANAIAAATQDPRFPPIVLEELPFLNLSVYILSKPQLIRQRFKLGDPLPEEIRPKKFGLIVSTADGRRGLLLPKIPEINTAQKQIEACFQKANLSPEEKVKLEIFSAKRHAFSTGRANASPTRQ